MSNQSRRLVLSTVSILAPCILGIVGMIHEGIPAGIWAQNPIFIAVFALLACVVMRLGIRIPDEAVVAAATLLIGATFLGPAIGGVHRWLRLPGFTLNAAAVMLPACVVVLTRLAGARRTACFVCGIAAIGLLLYLQPDASQLLAFALPMIVLLIGADIQRGLKGGVLCLLAILTLMACLRRDSLVQVSYTDGILKLLSKQSMLLYMAGILSLFLVPVWMMIGGIREKRKTWTCLGLYYALMILSTFFGSFPVPFMGYGASPILGVYIAIWLYNDGSQ